LRPLDTLTIMCDKLNLLFEVLLFCFIRVTNSELYNAFRQNG
jgi:hypothetical protein